MPVFNNIRVKPSHWILGCFCILTFSLILEIHGKNISVTNAKDTEETGRLLGYA